MRIDRYLQLNTEYSLRQVRTLLLDGQVCIDDRVVRDPAREVSRFAKVVCDGIVLNDSRPCYLMLYKPGGVVSATEHPEHTTVIDLIPESYRQDLHIAGRLDLNTTGLLILTNDGHWSRRITQPESKVAKVYRVETAQPVVDEAEAVFQQGIYFRYENLTTLPAGLERISPRVSRLTLYEGRYHQVKRMFGYFANEVTALHRESVGGLVLDPGLEPGEHRHLTEEEIGLF
ncbi:MAG: pseudouridine synthase [Amphritea sp.]|nr:pseudouridine synthase [Amphritea sp.]